MIKAEVVAVSVGKQDELHKISRPTIRFELDGIVGDRHKGFERDTWPSGDRQPAGVRRRNERHWTAVSIEELEQISTDMGLSEILTAADLGANLCLKGVPHLSKLPKGSIIKFPSGAELVVVEYNPPCADMGDFLASRFTRADGQKIEPKDFLKAAYVSRGIVGVVDVAGDVTVGDEVAVQIYKTPRHLVYPG